MQQLRESSANQEVLSYLRNAAARGLLAHAHALIGPTGSGRMELLENFLRDFLPAKSPAHPDIRTILPEADVITIDAIRAARSWLSMTPIAANKKALIVKAAGEMNAEAQNAFLKILEEPAENTYLFLLASHRRELLPTVYSRTIPLYCVRALREVEETDPQHLIHSVLAAGSVPERMRLWLSAAIPKEEMRSWLSASLPKLRQELVARRSLSIACALRNLIHALARPSGQNWQLVAECLIISI